MPIFIPLIVWASVAFSAGSAAYEVDKATGSHGKNWISNTVSGWFGESSTPPATTVQVQEQAGLNQNFNAQNGTGTGSTQQQLNSSTSTQTLTEQQKLAAAGTPPAQAEAPPPEQKEGDGFGEIVKKLLSGEKDFGALDEAGVATIFGGAAKLMGAGVAKTGVIAAVTTALWHFRKEILGALTGAFNFVSDRVSGPTNQLSFSEAHPVQSIFESDGSGKVKQAGVFGKVTDPSLLTSSNDSVFNSKASGVTPEPESKMRIASTNSDPQNDANHPQFNLGQI